MGRFLMDLLGHLWGSSWHHRFELLAEIFTLASIWLIWLPAKRMTDRLRGATITSAIPKDQGALTEMARAQRKHFYRQLLTWEPRDSKQLMRGLLFGFAASVIKVILMCLSAT
jgi:hypothetical protein